MEFITSAISSVTGTAKSTLSQAEKKLQGDQLVKDVFPDILSQIQDISVSRQG